MPRETADAQLRRLRVTAFDLVEIRAAFIAAMNNETRDLLRSFA